MAVNQIFELGDFQLQKGSVLPDAKLGYLTLGELNEARDNVIVSPTWFTASPPTSRSGSPGPVAHWTRRSTSSSSPTTSGPPSRPRRATRRRRSSGPASRGRRADHNVVAEQRLLTEVLGVERIKLVAGWSMGACRPTRGPRLFPNMVRHSARSTAARGPRTSTRSSSAATCARSRTTPPGPGLLRPSPVAGIKAMAAIYAGWAFSEPFYRKELFRFFGASSSDEFIEIFWDAFYIKNDANDLLSSSRPGSTTTSATTRTSAATSTRPWGRSPRGRSSSRPRPTATSRRSTPTTRRRRSRTPGCSGSTPTGATWRRSTGRPGRDRRGAAGPAGRVVRSSGREDAHRSARSGSATIIADACTGCVHRGGGRVINDGGAFDGGDGRLIGGRHQRRGRDSNPRTRLTPSRDFQSRPFNRSGTSPAHRAG